MVLQGALTRLMGQGLQQTSARRRAMFGDRSAVNNVARLMRCPEAARLNWTVWDHSGRPV